MRAHPAQFAAVPASWAAGTRLSVTWRQSSSSLLQDIKD